MGVPVKRKRKHITENDEAVTRGGSHGPPFLSLVVGVTFQPQNGHGSRGGGLGGG